MKIYLLNQRKDRLEFQLRQFNDLGISFTRFAALPYEGHKSALPFSVDHSKYWRGRTRPMTNSELSCMISHLFNLWHAVSLNGPAAIFEDDAILSPELPHFLQEVSKLNGVDYVNLETTCHRRKLLPILHPCCPLLHRLAANSTGTGAYILWPDGARKLLKTANKSARPADQIIWVNVTLKAFQAVPAFATQAVFLAHIRDYSLFPLRTVDVAHKSSRTILMRLFHTMDNVNRTTRIARQLHKGVYSKVIPFADCREIEPNRDQYQTTSDELSDCS